MTKFHIGAGFFIFMIVGLYVVGTCFIISIQKKELNDMNKTLKCYNADSNANKLFKIRQILK